jgi:hypothetical protein
MTDPKELISQLRKEFEQNSLVEAFVLVGSQAREDVYKATKYSDMEAYVIAKDENADTLEKQLPDLLQKTGKVLFSFKHAIGFVAVYDDLFRLELPVIKMSGLKGLFNRPKAQVVKVLIDKTDGKLEKILVDRPDEIDYAKEFNSKITNFWYWQILAVQYFKKGEYYNTRAVMSIHASALIWMYELLNNPKILLLETNKRVEQFLTAEQLTTIKQITPAYEPDAIHNSLTQVVDIFLNISSEIKKKYGYEFDESLELKVKPKLQELLQQK